MESVDPLKTAPHSAGTEAPHVSVPDHACDAHLHIFDPRFAGKGAMASGDMDVAGYRLLQRRIGTTRAVIVQAKYYGTDNHCLLDAVARLGRDAVGIAVVHPDVSDAELKRLHAGGVRGLRFSVWNPKDTVTTTAMIAPLAARIAPLGWHAQIHMSGDQIVDMADVLQGLPCGMVIDHMGRLPPAQGTTHPAFEIIMGLLAAGRSWLKISGAYLNTDVGGPDYSDAGKVAKAFIARAPERLVWGSDWPHVTEQHRKPDDARLIDLLAEWSGSLAIRDQILVTNAARLYGFPRP